MTKLQRNVFQLDFRLIHLRQMESEIYITASGLFKINLEMLFNVCSS